MQRFLSLTEVAGLVSRLEKSDCSPRQVRHLLVTGGLATDPQQRRRGQTRLYDLLDVAFVRLAVQLRQEGLSPWVARTVLTYLQGDITRAWKAAAPLALSVEGMRGRLEPASKSRPARAAAWVPLREIWRGLDAEVRRVCDTRDTLWMWRHLPFARSPIPIADRFLASARLPSSTAPSRPSRRGPAPVER